MWRIIYIYHTCHGDIALLLRSKLTLHDKYGKQCSPSFDAMRALIIARREKSPYRSTVCFSFLESCGGTSLRSEGPLPLTRLADDELRVPVVMVLKMYQREGGKTDTLCDGLNAWRLRQRVAVL